jgi:hypothetical protein
MHGRHAERAVPSLGLLVLLVWLVTAAGAFFQDSIGINIPGETLAPELYTVLRDGGFTFARKDLTWGKVEKVKGVYNFTEFDGLVKALLPSTRLYFIIDYGNPLYTKDGDAPITSEAIAAYCRFFIGAVSHFKGKGFIFEVWNEPNWVFWKPLPNASQYLRLVGALSHAFASRPDLADEIIVGPALAAPPLGGLGLDWKFLKRVLTNRDAVCLFDYISVHLYTQYEPETRIDDYREINTLISSGWAAAGGNCSRKGKAKPGIISGEWGWSTCKILGKPGPCVFEAQTGTNNNVDQAKFLSRMYLMNGMSKVDVSIYFDFIEGTGHYGIVDVNGSSPNMTIRTKPGYQAARTLNTVLTNFTFVARRPSKILEGRVCSAYSANKTDCGHFGISQSACEKRGCCFDVPHVSGPQCYTLSKEQGNESVYVLEFEREESVPSIFPATSSPVFSVWINGTGKAAKKAKDNWTLKPNVQVNFPVRAAGMCFHQLDYLGGETVPRVCSDGEGTLTVNVTDKPAFLVGL